LSSLFTQKTYEYAGYKLRKHIAKALSARSQAIRNALERYNTAAARLSPPRASLSWDSVVEYAFLADFDLLRDTRQDIRLRPWAKPAARLAMDAFFKMERAREEIKRLNIEIPRVITHMRDEGKFLQRKESELQPTNPALAHQIQLRRLERERFTEVHRVRFSKLAMLPGFTGNLLYGISIDRSMHEQEADAMEVDEGDGGVDETVPADSLGFNLNGEVDGVDEDDIEEELAEEELLMEKFSVLTLTLDQ